MILRSTALAAAAFAPATATLQPSGPLAAESSIQGVRRLRTSYLPDDTGTTMSVLGGSVTYLRYGKIFQWGQYPDPSPSAPTEIDLSSITDATPVKVAAGWYQSCAVLDDGKVACWGAMSRYGAMGEEAKVVGDTDGYRVPLIVRMNDGTGGYQDLDNVVDIASGTSTTCAVKSDRSLVCFGSDNVERVNSHYDGVEAATQVRFVVARGSLTAVVSEANELRVFWGNYADPRHTPAYPITQLSSSIQVCYLMDIPDDSMNMRCLGRNDYGGFGNGSTSSTWSTSAVSPTETTGLNSKISWISCASNACCAIKESDKSQWCWGKNSNDNLGVESSAENVLEPAPVITTGHLEQSLIHSIFVHRTGHVLLTDGSVYGWGKNIEHLLGVGDDDPNTIVSGPNSALPVFGGNAQAVITEPADWQPPANWPAPTGSDATGSPTVPEPDSSPLDTTDCEGGFSANWYAEWNSWNLGGIVTSYYDSDRSIAPSGGARRGSNTWRDTAHTSEIHCRNSCYADGVSFFNFMETGNVCRCYESKPTLDTSDVSQDQWVFCEIIATTPSIATCQNPVYCYNGQAYEDNTFEAGTALDMTCSQACGDGSNCCSGANACDDGRFVVCADAGDGSCVGSEACRYVGGLSTTVGIIAGGSCRGTMACLEFGNDSGQSRVFGDGSDVPSSVGTVSGNSCTGTRACFRMAINGGSGGDISNFSCRGYEACGNAGRFVGGGVGDISGGCTGSLACHWVGSNHQNNPYGFPYPSIDGGANMFTGSAGLTPIPTPAPTTSPTASPTGSPSVSPTTSPTTVSPTTSPTEVPTESPTTSPTSSPTFSPTQAGPWDLDYVDMKADFSNANTVTLEYILGVGREFRIDLYKKDCATHVNTALYSTIFDTTPISGNATHHTLTITHSFVIGALSSSDIWDATSSKLEVCQKMHLVEGNMDIIDDVREIDVDFDLEVDFNTTITLEEGVTENATDEVDFDNQVTAYKCNGGSTDTFEGNDAALAPNQELVVCIVSEDDNVDIAELTDMNIKQDGSPKVDVVVASAPLVTAITSVSVESDGIVAKTRVPIDRFSFETGKNITISGTVELAFAGTTGTRKLRVLVGEDSEEPEAGYALTVNLQSEGDVVGEGQAPIGASDGYAIMGKGIGGLGLLVLAVIGLVM